MDKVTINATPATALAAFNAVIQFLEVGAFIINPSFEPWFNRTSVTWRIGRAMKCGVSGITDLGIEIKGYATLILPEGDDGSMNDASRKEPFARIFATLVTKSQGGLNTIETHFECHRDKDGFRVEERRYKHPSQC